MGVHCTVCILYKTMMINQELGKEGVKKYKGKGGYSAEGLLFIIISTLSVFTVINVVYDYF